MRKLKTLSWCSMTPSARIKGPVHGSVEDHGGHGSLNYVHLSGPFCPYLRHGRQVGIDDLPEGSRMSAYRAYTCSPDPMPWPAEMVAQSSVTQLR